MNGTTRFLTGRCPQLTGSQAISNDKKYTDCCSTRFFVFLWCLTEDFAWSRAGTFQHSTAHARFYCLLFTVYVSPVGLNSTDPLRRIGINHNASIVNFELPPMGHNPFTIPTAWAIEARVACQAFGRDPQVSTRFFLRLDESQTGSRLKMTQLVEVTMMLGETSRHSGLKGRALKKKKKKSHLRSFRIKLGDFLRFSQTGLKGPIWSRGS